jgi:hypothetical protein
MNMRPAEYRKLEVFAFPVLGVWRLCHMREELKELI